MNQIEQQMTTVIERYTIGWGQCARCWPHFTRCTCPAVEV